MLLLFINTLSLYTICVTCEVIKHDPRQGRMITFEYENEDVEVALDFSIPVIKIPFKKTLNALNGFGLHEMNFPNININPIAISLGGLLVIFITLIAPILNKTFGWHNLDKSSRVSDDKLNYFGIDISEKLMMNSRRCPERIACWMSQKYQKPEVTQTWKKVMSNKLLSLFVNATVLEEAALNGLKGQNCQSYIPCPIEESSIPKIIKSLEILTKTNIY